MKKCKLLITDLDGTLIETLSGDTFPKGIWDMKLKLYVFEAIKNYAPDCLNINSITYQTPWKITRIYP